MNDKELKALCNLYDEIVAKIGNLTTQTEMLKQEARDIYQRIEKALK